MRKDTKCSHDKLYTEQCNECEKLGLEHKIGWMKPIVEEAEKRLKELNKIDCENCNDGF